MRIFRFVIILGLMVPAISSSQSQSGYHIVKKTLIGGEGGWDYLFADSKARRLYVSHGSHVVVLDADSVAVVGDIPNTEGVHGIAVAPEFGHGFTSNGRTSTVTMFDLKSLKALKEIPAGKNPDAILYDSFSRKLFAFNGRSQDATVLNAETGDSLATIPLGGKPEFAVSDLQGRVFVNNEDKSEIIAIDTKVLSVVARWPLAPGESPSGLAIDLKNHRLFSVCSNKLMIVLSTDDGKIVASLPIGAGVDACAFDPETGLAFSSNGEGTMTVVREESASQFTVIETVPTQRGARTMTLDLLTHAVFLTTADFGPAPQPSPERPRPRPSVLPNTFVVLQLQK